MQDEVKKLQHEQKEMEKSHLETQALCHSQQKYIEQLNGNIKEHQDKIVDLSVQLRLSEERMKTLKEQKGESLWHKLRKHVMVENINKLKEELSRITGRTYKKSEVGDAPGIISSATNSELISNIKDTFSNVDFNDKDAVNDAMKKYRELVRPAYDASGRLLRNDNSLYDDTNTFAKLIEKMKMSLSATHVDFSV